MMKTELAWYTKLSISITYFQMTCASIMVFQNHSKFTPVFCGTYLFLAIPFLYFIHIRRHDLFGGWVLFSFFFSVCIDLAAHDEPSISNSLILGGLGLFFKYFIYQNLKDISQKSVKSEGSEENFNVLSPEFADKLDRLSQKSYSDGIKSQNSTSPSTKLVSEEEDEELKRFGSKMEMKKDLLFCGRIELDFKHSLIISNFVIEIGRIKLDFEFSSTYLWSDGSEKFLYSARRLRLNSIIGISPDFEDFELFSSEGKSFNLDKFYDELRESADRNSINGKMLQAVNKFILNLDGLLTDKPSALPEILHKTIEERICKAVILNLKAG